jgi:lipoprotein NlpD
VIINHNDSFLSAYGYNERLVVAQGDEVAAGQVIAKMGLGPGRRPQLHFEIRQNGTPIDPLLQLPR